MVWVGDRGYQFHRKRLGLLSVISESQTPHTSVFSSDMYFSSSAVRFNPNTCEEELHSCYLSIVTLVSRIFFCLPVLRNHHIITHLIMPQNLPKPLFLRYLPPIYFSVQTPLVVYVHYLRGQNFELGMRHRTSSAATVASSSVDSLAKDKTCSFFILNNNECNLSQEH